MKAILVEKMNEIRIPDDLHKRCMDSVMKAKLEIDTDLCEQEQGRHKEGENQS